MRCVHCGNNILGNPKFCTCCGQPMNGGNAYVQSNGKRQLYYTNGYNNEGTYNNVSPNSKGSKGIFIFFGIFMAIMGLPIMLIAIFSFVFMGSMDKIDYVEFDNVSIPTIYTVLGERDVCSAGNMGSLENENMEIGYCDPLMDKEIAEYFKYLVDEEGFVYNNEYYIVKYLEDDMIVTVRVMDDNSTLYYETYHFSQTKTNS